MRVLGLTASVHWNPWPLLGDYAGSPTPRVRSDVCPQSGQMSQEATSCDHLSTQLPHTYAVPSSAVGPRGRPWGLVGTNHSPLESERGLKQERRLPPTRGRRFSQFPQHTGSKNMAAAPAFRRGHGRCSHAGARCRQLDVCYRSLHLPAGCLPCF